MKNLQTVTDKAAIGLSVACAVHCLALPLFIVLLPSIAALRLNDEAFHVWMVVAVVPTSVYALTMGCKRHKRYRFLTLGCIGLACLILAVALGEALLGEAGEKALTAVGAGIIAYAHYKNYRLCRRQDSCVCHDSCDVPSK